MHTVEFDLWTHRQEHDFIRFLSVCKLLFENLILCGVESDPWSVC